jgi:replicative DNA helicase
MAEIRDSGHVEQDADKIFLLHRPDYYNPQERPGIVELIIEKNREGYLGPIEFSYDNTSQRLRELPLIEDQIAQIHEENKKAWGYFG